MNTFYIIRHGETENNRAKRLSGWIDTPLTADGLLPTRQAIVVLRQLPPIEACYASDLGRAFVTAYEVMFALGLIDMKIIKVPELREVNYGDAANMPIAEAYERYPQLDRDTLYTPPNGESLAHMQRRVINAITALDRQYTNATILIVAHSGVMAALNASYQGADFGKHNISEAYPHDYVGEFTVADGVIASFREYKADA